MKNDLKEDTKNRLREMKSKLDRSVQQNKAEPDKNFGGLKPTEARVVENRLLSRIEELEKRVTELEEFVAREFRRRET